MKALFSAFSLLFFVLSALGQDVRSTPAAQQACGPMGVRYDKGNGLEEHPSLPAISQGKALVYLVQLEGTRSEACIGNCAPFVKFGLDGQWKGATWGNSFVFAAIEPGDHHLCVNLDVPVKKLQQVVALRGLHAEPGKTYFYGVRVSNVGGAGGTYGLDLEPLDADEATMLLQSYPFSKLKPKP